MVLAEIGARFKRLSKKVKFIIAFIFLLEIIFSAVSLGPDISKWGLFLSAPLYFAIWRLPGLICLSVVLLDEFGVFERIRLTKTMEFQVNLILLALSVGINVLMTVVPSSLTVLIRQNPSLDGWFMTTLITTIDYTMMFTIIVMILYLGYSISSHKYIIAGLLLGILISISILPIEGIQQYFFFFIFAQYNGYGFSLTVKLLVFSGLLLCLLSATQYAVLNREYLRRSL